MADPNPYQGPPTPTALRHAAIEGQRPDRADQGRRQIHAGRGAAAVLTAAVFAASIVGCSASESGRGSATPASAATTGPHLTSGLLTLAAHPLLTEEQGHRVHPGAEPALLSACVKSPLTWDAAESDAATFGRPGQSRFGNEFVLRFDTVAHNAVINAWRQFHYCPTSPKVGTDPWSPPLQGGPWGLSEYFANQRVRSGTVRDARHGATPVAYSLRVARRQNVVVVVETTDVDDRAEFVLGWAMSHATADRQRERVILSTVGGRSGW